MLDKKYDAPELIDTRKKENKIQAFEEISELFGEQSFAVLATHGTEESYNSLISFVVNDDFSQIIFASPVDTKKIHNIRKNKQVSLLIDNRDTNPESINDILAVTASGKADIIEEEKKKEKLANALIKKHSYLADFIKASTTAIIEVDISNYYYVSRFQEVFEWSPKNN